MGKLATSSIQWNRRKVATEEFDNKWSGDEWVPVALKDRLLALAKSLPKNTHLMKQARLLLALETYSHLLITSTAPHAKPLQVRAASLRDWVQKDLDVPDASLPASLQEKIRVALKPQKKGTMQANPAEGLSAAAAAPAPAHAAASVEPSAPSKRRRRLSGKGQE